MNRPGPILAITVIVNACIWGFAILMCSHKLSGTGAYQQIQPILGACSAMSAVVVGGGLVALVKILKQSD